MNSKSIAIFLESSFLKSLWDKSKCINSGCGLPIKLQISSVHILFPPSLLKDISNTLSTVFLLNPLNKYIPPFDVILL